MVLYDGTMASHSNTVNQIKRLNGGLHFKKVEALLKALGAEVFEGSGSTVTFAIGARKLTVDRPHPRKECGRGLVKRVRTFLEEIGEL